jgi:hypothetical protein
MHTFHINVFVQFLVSSACFEHNVFIIRKTVCTCSFVCCVCLSCVYVSSLADGRMCLISTILTTVDRPCQLTCRPVDSRVCTDEGACLLPYWGLLMSVSHLSVVATYFFDLCTTWIGLLWYKYVACKNGREREGERETVVYETAGKRRSERGHAFINSTSKVSESSRVVCYEDDPADGPYLYLCC